ncbi:MAG: PilZ domain-containing protein [Candidatus Polarisedimenticolia bacterium]|nr:PilZ domain-containing protein [bacterium]
MRDVRLILMARPGPACDALRAEIEACGAACLTAANPVEMRETLFREPVNGLALDVPTLVAADRIGKGIIRHLVDLYPVVRVRWDAAAGKAFALYFGKTEGELGGLGTFVARDCAVFRARKLRSEARIAASLPALLCRGPAFDAASASKTVVVDVSLSGCFLYCVEPWEAGERATFVLPDVAGAAPIAGVVRRVVPWGDPYSMPGIGVRFDEMPQERADAIVAFAREAAANRIVVSPQDEP